MYHDSNTHEAAELHAMTTLEAPHAEEYEWLRNKVQVQAERHQRNLALAMLETWILRATGRLPEHMDAQAHPHAALRKMQ